MRKATKAEREEAIAWFRENCPKGSTIYTVLRHRSSSGMLRRIGLVVILPGAMKKDEPTLRFPDYAGAVVYNDKATTADDPEGITVRGCGMDMGFELVYSIAQAVYGDGYALKQRWI
jgi:hypothetical protein